ncbi:unnamed protein product [Orchesella dallaii]|uniref:Uncharacterized protein n=1 Tax=Orchesella dallaii TaxID=48710 RepID=A0ABP1QZ37_9HEXA
MGSILTCFGRDGNNCCGIGTEVEESSGSDDGGMIVLHKLFPPASYCGGNAAKQRGNHYHSVDLAGSNLVLQDEASGLEPLPGLQYPINIISPTPPPARKLSYFRRKTLMD